MGEQFHHGERATATLVQSISSMELQRRENIKAQTVPRGRICMPPPLSVSGTGHNSNFMADIIDSVKDLFSSPTQKTTPRRILHNPKNLEEFADLLKSPHIDVNERNHQGDTPLHSLAKKQFSKIRLKFELLAALLMHSDVDVNRQNDDGNTALHIAAESYDIQSIKLLLTFGAKINMLNSENKTPLDLVEGPYRLGIITKQDSILEDYSVVELYTNTSPTTPSDNYVTDNSIQNGTKSPVQSPTKSRLIRQLSYTSDGAKGLAEFLKNHGAHRGRKLTQKHSLYSKKESVKPFLDVLPTEKESTDYSSDCSVSKSVPHEIKNEKWTEKIPKHYYQLTTTIDSRLSDLTRSLAAHPDEGLSLAIQLREMKMLKEAGSRILFLDGGGMRGLIQIEILSQLEEQTGRKITELFDWIVGTSTGGVVALGLVYAKKSLKELRQLYFSFMKNVFGKPRFGMTCDTGALEQILKDVFGDMCMNDVNYPRVLVPAVNKSTINLKLHFFNNCFNNEFSKEKVWKVARYTTAAPIFFNESDNYVDGGILANNPSASGLTQIQDFYRRKEQRLPISLVVSLGSGKLPNDELGNADAQDYLFFGRHWFKTKTNLPKRVENLKTLLSNAVGESEVIAENVRSRCLEQGISYYRLSPQLEEIVPAGETDMDKLIDLVLCSKSMIATQGVFSSLVLRFHQCSEANRKMTVQFRSRAGYKLHRSPAFHRKLPVVKQ